MHTVSVLLPVYNGEKYILEAVKSILDQSFKDFDLYVIDDGSSDNTINQLKNIVDNRLQILINQSNRGLIYTLNKGLDLLTSRGYQYIIRMDADDISLPQRFAKQIAFMNDNPDIGLCGSWVEEFNDNGIIKVSKRSANHKKIIAELFFQNTIWHPSVIIRTEVLKKYNLRYESVFLHAEDFALWCRMSQVTKLANIQEVLLHYRVHNANVSKLYMEHQRNTCILITEMNLNNLLYKYKNSLNKNAKDHISDTYIRLLNKIPVDVNLITKEEILVFHSLKNINAQTEAYNNLFFEKSLSDFMFHYWSLWCKKYSFKTFILLFVYGYFFSRHWSLQQKVIIIGKCILRWKARV